MRKFIVHNRKAVMISLALMIYFTVLTLISFTTTTQIAAAGENLADYQDIVVWGDQDKAWVDNSGLHFRDSEGAEKSFSVFLMLQDIQQIHVRFNVYCPAEFAGTAVLHVDLYAEGYDAAEQEFVVELRAGQNEVSQIIDKGMNAPPQAQFRIFCLDPVQCDISGLSVQQMKEVMHSGTGACVVTAVILAVLLLVVGLTGREKTLKKPQKKEALVASAANQSRGQLKEVKPMSKRRERICWKDWPAFIPAVFLSFTFFAFGPIEIYMTNMASFPFQIFELVLESLFMFLCSLLLLSVITLLLRKRIVVTSTIFGLALAAYIQGNWMFVSYGEMDGTAIDWSSYGAWPIINLAIWLVLILVPVMLSIWIKNKDKLKKCMNWTAVCILTVQCITLGTLTVTTTFPQNSDYYVARDEYMLELSGKKNVVVMLFDGFQSSYFQQIIEDVPDAGEIFEDFVFFDNAIGTSRHSEEGSATILTGNQLRADLPFQENIDYIYDSSEFFPALEKNGYDTRYYIETKMVSGAQHNVIKNVLELEGENIPWFKLPNLMSRITAFRYMPHMLKQYFWFSYNDIDSLKTERKLDIEEFRAEDSAFNQDVLSGKMSAELDKNAYRFYYFFGVHPPYRLDENGNSVQYDNEVYTIDYVKDIHDNQMMYRQALGSIQIMKNFIQALKDAGIYEKTDIIITADHGWENRYNPILLVKCQDTIGEFSVSHAPVSYISDFGPTVLSLIDDSYQGKTVFDYSEDEERERSFYEYSINSADRSYNYRDTWYIDSLEVRQENFYFHRTESETQYQLNDDIVFTEDNDGTRYFERGIWIDRGNWIWSMNKKGTMLLNISNVTTDLIGEFRFKGLYAPPQRLVIRCEDRVLYDEEIHSSETVAYFMIPKSCIKDGKLTLNLEYPNAVSPHDYEGSEDVRVLAFAFDKIRFCSVEDEKSPLNYRLGDDIMFTADNDGRRYFLSGTSTLETDFSWSSGNSGQMLLHVGENTGDLTGEFHFKMVYAAPQRLVVRCGNQALYDEVVTSAEEPVRFSIPERCIENGMLKLDLEYPDAVSPQGVDGSEDYRMQAFAFENICFYQAEK